MVKAGAMVLKAMVSGVPGNAKERCHVVNTYSM